MALNLSAVFDLDGLLDWLIHKHISEVYFLLSEVGLWTDALSFELQWQPFLCAADVAVCQALVVVGLGWHESHSYGNFAVRPDLTYLRLNTEDVVLEQKQIVLDGFADCAVLARQGQFGFFLPLLEVGLGVLFLIRRIFEIVLVLISLLALHHLSQKHQLLGFFLVQLLPQQLLLGLFLLLGTECSPFEIHLYIGLVDDLESLLGLQTNIALLHGNKSFAEVHVG